MFRILLNAGNSLLFLNTLMVIILKFGEPAGYLNNNFITSETTCNTFIINK
jgi:hypothetical protein